MAAPLSIRRYRPEDREACLSLFEGNMPLFFVKPEQALFEAFLGELPGPYLVVEDSSGRLVACGGLALEGAGDVRLCWGIVRAERHREGIGTFLVRVRLALACRLPGIHRVSTKTWDGNVTFFEREGLRPVTPIEGYYRPSHRLLCELDAPRRAIIEERLSAQLARGHRVEDGLLTHPGQ
jgi:hypothetical protein